MNKQIDSIYTISCYKPIYVKGAGEGLFCSCCEREVFETIDRSYVNKYKNENE